MDIEKNKLVTLDNNRSYVVLDQIEYNSDAYCFITDLIEDNSFMIVKKIERENNWYFVIIDNEELENNLKGMFATRLGIEI